MSTPNMTRRPRLLGAEDLPSPPRQRRSKHARARVVAAALDLFAAHGYEGTSIEQIAERAEVATGAFYVHFRSKRQLLLVLMDEFLEQLSEVSFDLPASNEPATVVRQLVTQAFETDRRYAGACRAWREAALSASDVAERDREIRRWSAARVEDLFGRLQRLSGARVGIDVAALARLMDGFFWSLITDSGTMSRREFAQAVEAATQLIIHGLFTDTTHGKVVRDATNDRRANASSGIRGRRRPPGKLRRR